MRKITAIACCLLVLRAVLTSPGAAAAAGGATDISGQVAAGADVALNGDSVVDLPPGTTTYNGVISGQGTLTVAAPNGPATLILTKDSDFTLPAARRRQVVTTSGGSHPVNTVSNPDPPAVVVEAGATLQYGDGGSTGIIGHYPYNTPGYALNEDNIQVDGTLRLQIINRMFNLGTISGSGLVSQPRFNWGTPQLAGTLPFSGVYDNGTGTNFGSPYTGLSLPNARAILNNGSAILGTPRFYTLVLHQNFYERNYGSDINFHSADSGLVVMTGVDSYSDGGPDTDPTLSSPALNTAVVPHTVNFRGINIEGAHVQWGDGSPSRFFLPATPQDSYINIHRNGTLAFDYGGPVTLDTPVSGGVYHQSLSTPAYASVSLVANPGNAVTFATPQNYHGATTIGKGATLLLGTGQAGGDSSLLTGDGADAVVDGGGLVIQNAKTAISLPPISGGGTLTQAGPATATLTGAASYSGATTVSGGTLALAAGSGGIASSSGLALTGAGARFDISAAGNQTVRDLSGAAGSRVDLGAHTLTVGTAGSTTYAGGFAGDGGGVTKVGTGALTLTGRAATPGGAWQVNQGTLDLAGGTLAVGDFTQASGTALAVRLGGQNHAAPIRATGAVRLAGALKVSGGAGLPVGTKITLVGGSGRAVSGAFDGLAEGAALDEGADGKYQISYSGGTGRDVVLTVVNAAAAASSGASGGPAAAAAGAGPVAAHSSVGVLIAVACAVLAGIAVVVFLSLLWRKRRRGPADPGGDRAAVGGAADDTVFLPRLRR